MKEYQLHRYQQFISGRKNPFIARSGAESKILPNYFRESLRDDLKYTNEGFDTTKRMVKSRIDGICLEEKIYNVDTDMEMDGLTISDRSRLATEQDIMWPTSSSGLHQETSVDLRERMRLIESPAALEAKDKEKNDRPAVHITPAPSAQKAEEEEEKDDSVINFGAGNVFRPRALAKRKEREKMTLILMMKRKRRTIGRARDSANMKMNGKAPATGGIQANHPDSGHHLHGSHLGSRLGKILSGAQDHGMQSHDAIGRLAQLWQPPNQKLGC